MSDLLSPSADSVPQRLLLVDGSSYLYRAFHAMPDLRAEPGNPASQPTGAIRGMVNMMASLKSQFPSAYVACVFDASGPTFRDAIYNQYKANRPPMPDDLRAQIEPIHAVVRALGWPVLNVPGVEADDVIGTLAHTAAQQGMEVIVSSGDKDLSQLVNEHITIIDTMNGKKRDVAGVTAEFGVPPSLMLDYQTLVGDTVDNVPGVEKVGPKTAAKWLTEYGNLEALVARSGEIKGVAGENLRKALDWLPTARVLLTIRTDCELDSHVPGMPNLDALKVREPQRDELVELYERFGFKGLAKSMREGLGSVSNNSVRPELVEGQDALRQAQRERSQTEGQGDMFGDEPAPARELKTDTRIAWTMAELDDLIAQISAASLTAFDTETTSLDEMRAEVVGLSFSTEVGKAWYVPLAHQYPGVPDQLNREAVLEKLRPWLESSAHAKLGQHVKYDQHVLANHGVAVKGYTHDTMLQSYVLEVHKTHGLGSLALRHCGRTGISYEDICGKGAHQIGFAQVDIDKAAEYSGEDSDQTLDVHLKLWPLLQANPKLQGIYELEMASSEALFRIERNGVLIDAQVLSQQSHELGQRIMALEKESHELAGQPFNLASPKQIGEIFFGKLGLPVVKKTATGAPSTDEEVLEKLADDYPLPARILEHRSLSKLKGTYTDKLAQMALPATACA